MKIYIAAKYARRLDADVRRFYSFGQVLEALNEL